MDQTVVFSNIFILFILLGMGYFAGRRGIVSANATRDMTALLLKITLPATVFSSMVRDFDAELLRSGIQALWLGALFLLLGLALVFPLARWLRVPQKQRGVWRFAAACPNNGFMGFPIILAVYGEDGLFLAALINLDCTLIFYTIGVWLVSRDAAAGERLSLRGVLLSNVNLAMIAGLFFFLLQIQPPAFLTTAVGYLADITTPLSMLVTGFSLAHDKPSDLFREKQAFSAALTRLILLPLLFLLLIHLLPLDANALAPRVVVLNLAMPSAALGLILATQYNCDVDLAGKSIFLSSLLSAATIPLLLLIL